MADSVFCSDFIRPVFNFLAAQPDYIFKFDENLQDLKYALMNLEKNRDDLLIRVNAEEMNGRQRLHEVNFWLTNVQAIEANTRILVADASAAQQRLSTYGFCSIKLISDYICGKKISHVLDEVQVLRCSGFFGVVAVPTPFPVVKVCDVRQTFGLDKMFEKTWESLMDSQNRMLGIYGMGGVGKTTLLALINNKLLEVHDKFDVVIWVKVSKDAEIGKIQDDIGKRLGLYDKNWCRKPQRERASDIHRVLKDAKRRFVLLLDDLLWEVNLSRIGIPLLGREYKVVFTTRFKDVCRRMGANQDIEVQCLGDDHAWDLFKLKSRCSGLSEGICDIAKKIAANCCGLPLALEVIGKSLASKTVVDEWRRALNTLESSPRELKGTRKGIFEVLKLSYDHLEKRDAKLCFQYCALFPKAYCIEQDELVEYWIAEGIIDEEHGRRRAMDRGNDIIDTLVEACLLLKDGETKVYMHDMIREMALWIVTEFEHGERFVVMTDAGFMQLPNVTDWTTVTKMSLMNNEIKSISEFPDQARPTTLFLQNNKLVKISGKFLEVMSNLVVLDLSRNPGLTELPEEISMLVALRYLSLLGTRIKVLPDGLRNLTKLIHLDLESTSSLQSITLISRLQKLQVLRFYGSAAALDLPLLKDLELMHDLQILSVTVREVDVLEAILESTLAGKTQGLYLDGAAGALRNLRNMKMINCDIIEPEIEGVQETRHDYSISTPPSSNQRSPSNTWFKNLLAVELVSCEGLKDVTWLIYAPNLESLSIKFSSKMEEIISKKEAGDFVVEPFLKLEVLQLYYMDELRSIHWNSLSFPRLQKVDIKSCPKLRKLPFNSNSVQRIDDLIIEVDDEWLNGVEWESGAQKRFRPLIRTASTA